MALAEQTIIGRPWAYSADAVMAQLPEPNYPQNYQPSYADNEALQAAVETLQTIEPVTSPRQIDALQAELTRLANGEIDEPIIITGHCAEEVDANRPIERLVEDCLVDLRVAMRGLGKVIHILRNRGQHAKPRSSEYEKGTDTVSYMGDSINGRELSDRSPDPARMVAAARQDSVLEAALTAATGRHVPAAHEALLLVGELSSIQIDPATGERYLLCTDMPWIGKRTNDLDGPHVAMLATVRNPIGVKIGADSTPSHIAALAQRLNPDNISGKLTFMLRTGPNEAAARQAILEAIRDYAPKSLIMYDVHGVTKTAPDGVTKIRAVPDIIADIRATADACRAAGLQLHGLHLETIADDTRLECVDHDSQMPTHPGNVDPQLNPRQLRAVLNAVASCLPRKRTKANMHSVETTPALSA